MGILNWTVVFCPSEDSLDGYFFLFGVIFHAVCFILMVNMSRPMNMSHPRQQNNQQFKRDNRNQGHNQHQQPQTGDKRNSSHFSGNQNQQNKPQTNNRNDNRQNQNQNQNQNNQNNAKAKEETK